MATISCAAITSESVYVNWELHILLYAKLRIFNGISVTIGLQKYFAVIYAEDAAVANLAALAGGKYLYVPPTSVKIVSQGDTISEFEYRAVGFPD